MNWKLELSVCSTGAFPVHFQPNETRNMQIAPNAGKEKLPTGACPGKAPGICAAPQRDWISPLASRLRVLLTAEENPHQPRGKGSGHGETSAVLP